MLIGAFRRNWAREYWQRQDTMTDLARRYRMAFGDHDGLKRRPRYAGQWRGSVVKFVCNGLSTWLRDMLIDGATCDEILAALARRECDVGVGCERRADLAADRRLKIRTSREYQANRYVARGMREFFDAAGTKLGHGTHRMKAL
jgi:hypothetical protein